MKHLPGKPKPYYRRYFLFVFVLDDRSFGFAVIRNLDRYFLDDIFNGGRFFFQLRERVVFGAAV
jgi:hypothetical protein